MVRSRDPLSNRNNAGKANQRFSTRVKSPWGATEGRSARGAKRGALLSKDWLSCVRQHEFREKEHSDRACVSGGRAPDQTLFGTGAEL